jgi:hypothetical protein
MFRGLDRGDVKKMEGQSGRAASATQTNTTKFFSEFFDDDNKGHHQLHQTPYLKYLTVRYCLRT